MLAFSALIAPRLELYTHLVCRELDADSWSPENGDLKSDMWSVSSSRPVPCSVDPVVQARVAKLLASQCTGSCLRASSLTNYLLVTATVQGVLSCLTTTFWGSVSAPVTYLHCIHLKPLKFSDRYGRVPYLGLNLTALLLADAALAALAVVPQYVPGGYWFIMFVSAFEGLVGGGFCLVDSTTSDDFHFAGHSAAGAATHAYLADCSDPATRSAFVPLAHWTYYKTDTVDHAYSLDSLGCSSSVWRSGQLWVRSLNVYSMIPTWYSTLRLACMPSMHSSCGSSFPSLSYLHRWKQLVGPEKTKATGPAASLASSRHLRYWRLSHKKGQRVHKVP